MYKHVLYATFIVYRFGGDPEAYPDPYTSPNAFNKRIGALNNAMGTVYSPIKGTMRPWVEGWLEIWVILNSVNTSS